MAVKRRGRDINKMNAVLSGSKSWFNKCSVPCLYALCFLCDRPFILNLKLTSTLNFVTALVRGHLQKVPNRKCFRNMFFTLFEVQLRTCAITFIMHKVCVSANWKPWLPRWWWSIISGADGWEWEIDLWSIFIGHAIFYLFPLPWC